MNILYAASTSGHLRAFHKPYLEWLLDAGHFVRAVGSGGGDGVPCSKWTELPLKKSMLSPGNFVAARSIAQLMRLERYGLVVVNTSLAAFFVRLGLIMAGKRDTQVVNIVHGYLFDGDTPPMKRRLLLGAEKLVAGVTDTILTMNTRDAAIARKYKLCRGEVLGIPGMGVDLGRFTPPSEGERLAARAALGIAEGALVLIFAAEFSARKNQRFLINALPLLPENAVLLLPGDGTVLDADRELACSLGLASRVIFPGRVSDMPLYYRAADICVSSSRIEGLPFNVMEAMSCALPCVLTRIKGHEDLVTDGVNGRLYPFGDANAFAACVRELAERPETASGMGRQARRDVEKYGLDAAFEAVCSALGRYL